MKDSSPDLTPLSGHFSTEKCLRASVRFKYKMPIKMEHKPAKTLS